MNDYDQLAAYQKYLKDLENSQTEGELEAQQSKYQRLEAFTGHIGSWTVQKSSKPEASAPLTEQPPDDSRAALNKQMKASISFDQALQLNPGTLANPNDAYSRQQLRAAMEASATMDEALRNNRRQAEIAPDGEEAAIRALLGSNNKGDE